MATRDMVNRDPLDDPYPLDPAESRNALTGGIQGASYDRGPGGRLGVTDPPVRDNTPAPVNSNPYFDPGTNITPGQDIPLRTMPEWTAQPAAAAPTDPTLSAIDALYKQYGITDGGNGSGFADRAYWLAHPSEISNGRLAADLAGTGTDQPDGTPGTGPWQNSGRQARSGGGGPVAAPVAAPSVASAVGASVGPDSGTSAYNEQIRQILLQQIAGLSGPTTADSPDVAPAISAFNTQSQRDQATNREALAERFYAGSDGGQALGGGGFNTAVQQGLEKSAGDRANFTGSTVFTAAQSKRQQLQQMLQTATSAGLTDAAQQIQAKIAAIDADLRRQGLNQQNSQFGQSLAQQNSQFGDSLGMTYAQLIAQQNRDSLLAGLG